MRDGSTTGATRPDLLLSAQQRETAYARLHDWQSAYALLATTLGMTEAEVWERLRRAADRVVEVTGSASTGGDAGFGAKLRIDRIAAGLTLRDAARLLGYTPAAVQRWEKGKCLPKRGVVVLVHSLYAALAECPERSTQLRRTHPENRLRAGASDNRL